MRKNYFDCAQVVYALDMIKNLDSFDNREVVAFLYDCVVYEECFCKGTYGYYAQEGLIGKALLRLKELPLTLTFDSDGSDNG